ncbi:hypothetical protein LJE16_16860 [Planktothrix agardhii 1810]|jgi:hypothetical protein|nr:hypothetical protein [Planktothrix agardhii 1810]
MYKIMVVVYNCERSPNPDKRNPPTNLIRFSLRSPRASPTNYRLLGILHIVFVEFLRLIRHSFLWN